MYILLAIVQSWGELDTEESGGENDVGTDILDEFSSGENQRFMMEKEML